MVMHNDKTNMTSSENDEGAQRSECKQKEEPTNIKRQSERQQPQQQQRTTNHNANTANSENNPDVLLTMLFSAVKKLWVQIKLASNFVMVDLGGYQLIDCLIQWCIQHPQMAICLLAAGLVLFLPIFLFVAFILSTIVMTFTGFLVLEGTLLTILTMMMFGLFGALVVMLLFFAIVGIATYFGVAHAFDKYGGTETVKISLTGETNHTGNSKDENVAY